MIGGYAPQRADHPKAHWISYVSVDDVDAAAKAAATSGGRVVDAPYDIPTVGRAARIADPQGAELCLFKSSNGDPPDGPPVPGRWFCWNELHTTDPAKALSFYEKVIGFAHRDVPVPGGTYHIVSRGGIDRGGATSHSMGDEPPHWLPYVAVEDADSTIARAKKLGAKICVAPADIPGVGRFGAFEDPLGAALAILKPFPIEKQQPPSSR